MAKIEKAVVESTFMRFTVEINTPGFPDDGGDGLAKDIGRALLETAVKFDTEAKVTETTE
jgi:hypothetical protein